MKTNMHFYPINVKTDMNNKNLLGEKEENLSAEYK